LSRAEAPLAQEVRHRVLDLADLASVSQTLGQPPAQLQRGSASLEQDRSAIGAAVPVIELRAQRRRKQIRKQDRLSCVIFNCAKAS
jgi:hypothetical protein